MPEELRCQSVPLSYATNFSQDLVFATGAINNFSRKKILKKEGRHSDYSRLVIFSLESSSQIHEVCQTRVRETRRSGRAGAAGGPPCARGAGRPSVLQGKAAKLGCFGLKTPGGDRESLKGTHLLKTVGTGKEDASCCPRAST